MGPDIQYQMIISRVADLREEAAGYRRVREAQSARKGHEGGGHRRLRAAFGKFRTT
jgi:hypothetical protein